MKKLFVILGLFLTGTFSVSALEQNVHYDSLYTLGNSAYQEQNFEEALKFYSMILESGLESADLYYNIANSHYKLQQVTQSILYYEKALKLKPQEKDIQYNLDLANNLIVDKIESLPTPFFKEWWYTLVNSLALNTFGYLSIGFIILSMIGLLIFLRSNSIGVKRMSFYLFIVFLLAAGTTYLFANSQFQNNHNTQHAIVFSTRTNIYAAPNTTSTVLFIIHDGLKVKILKTEQQWLNIMLPDGSIGWIPEEALVVI